MELESGPNILYASGSDADAELEFWFGFNRKVPLKAAAHAAARLGDLMEQIEQEAL